MPLELLERMAGALRVLAHPRRLQVIEILQAEVEAPVHGIVARLGLPQAAVSQHLNYMRRSGLLKSERKGKEVWYSVADPNSLTVLDCIRKKAGRRLAVRRV